jgi:hypothetical protein
MASVVSVASGTSIVYTITDNQGNTATVTAAPAPGTVAFTSSGLMPDGQALLQTLLQMLDTGLRPKAIPGTAASFSN